MITTSIAPIPSFHRSCAAGADPPAAPRGASSGRLASANANTGADAPASASPPCRPRSPASGCAPAQRGSASQLRRRLAGKIRAACVLGTAFVLAGCSFLGGSGEDPIPSLAPLEPLAAVRTAWTTDAGSGIGGRWLVLVPAVAGGRVYVADAKGRISAYDAASGRSVWRTNTGADITGGVGTGGGLVVAGTEDGVVLALAAETGTVAWRTELSSEVLSSPRVAGGPVVARTLDGKLFGLDAQSGERLWSYDAGVPSLSVRGTSSPVIVSGVAISGFDNGRLAAVRSTTGEVLWEALVSAARGSSELERLTDIDTEPVVEGGVVYAASHERAVAAFEAETGRELWRRAIASRSGLAVDSGLLYVAAIDGSIQALDRLSGGTVWTEDSLAGRGPAWPVLHGPFVAFTDREGYVHWLRREDGRPAARTRSGGGQLAGPPARHADALIAYRAQGRLTAFEVR